MGYNANSVLNIKPWPNSSSQHELRSIRKALAASSYTPDELRLTEIESAFRRPMIQLTMLNQRVENRSQYDFSTIKNSAITFFGSSVDDLDEDERHFEALQVFDYLSEFFGRANVHGPLIPIYDFSKNEPELTDDWMFIEAASVNLVKDEYNLWMAPVDLRYSVSRDEVPNTEIVPDSIIMNIQRRIEIQ